MHEGIHDRHGGSGMRSVFPPSTSYPGGPYPAGTRSLTISLSTLKYIAWIVVGLFLYTFMLPGSEPATPTTPHVPLPVESMKTPELVRLESGGGGGMVEGGVGPSTTLEEESVDESCDPCSKDAVARSCGLYHNEILCQDKVHEESVKGKAECAREEAALKKRLEEGAAATLKAHQEEAKRREEEAVEAALKKLREEHKRKHDELAADLKAVKKEAAFCATHLAAAEKTLAAVEQRAALAEKRVAELEAAGGKGGDKLHKEGASTTSSSGGGGSSSSGSSSTDSSGSGGGDKHKGSTGSGGSSSAGVSSGGGGGSSTSSSGTIASNSASTGGKGSTSSTSSSSTEVGKGEPAKGGSGSSSSGSSTTTGSKAGGGEGGSIRGSGGGGSSSKGKEDAGTAPAPAAAVAPAAPVTTTTTTKRGKPPSSFTIPLTPVLDTDPMFLDGPWDTLCPHQAGAGGWDARSETRCPSSRGTCGPNEFSPSLQACCPWPNATLCGHSSAGCCPGGTECVKASGHAIASRFYCVEKGTDRGVIAINLATCKAGPNFPMHPTLPNVVWMGDSISIGAFPAFAKALEGVAMVHHAPWGGNGGAEETAYGDACLHHFLHSPSGFPINPDLILFNFGMHDVSGW